MIVTFVERIEHLQKILIFASNTLHGNKSNFSDLISYSSEFIAYTNFSETFPLWIVAFLVFFLLFFSVFATNTLHRNKRNDCDFFSNSGGLIVYTTFSAMDSNGSAFYYHSDDKT